MSTDHEKPRIFLAQAGDFLDIRTLEGKILYELKLKEIAQGFKEGWLNLDDEIRKDETAPWYSIRETLGKTEFGVKVYIDTQKAFAWKYGVSGGMIVGGIAAGVAILLSANTGTDVSTYLLGTNGADVLIGALAGTVSGVIGGVIGFASGYGLGLSIGSLQKDNYKIPTSRNPLPDWVQLSPTFLTPESRSEAASSILSGTCFLCEKPIKGKKMETLSKDHPPVGFTCNNCGTFFCLDHKKELNFSMLSGYQSPCPKCGGSLRGKDYTLIQK